MVGKVGGGDLSWHGQNQVPVISWTIPPTVHEVKYECKNIFTLFFLIVNLVFYVNYLIHFGSPKWSCTIYYGHNIDKYMLNYDHTRGKPSKETKFRWYHIVYQKIVMTKIYIYIYFNEQQLCQIVYFSVYPKFILILSWSNKPGYRVVMICVDQIEYHIFKVVLFCHT